MADAATRWAAELEAWAVPAHILEAAPQTPWVFPPDMFSAPEPGSVPRSGSTAIAAAAIPDGGTVLDVGCGGAASDRCTGTGEKSHQGAQVNVGHAAFTKGRPMPRRRSAEAEARMLAGKAQASEAADPGADRHQGSEESKRRGHGPRRGVALPVEADGPLRPVRCLRRDR